MKMAGQIERQENALIGLTEPEKAKVREIWNRLEEPHTCQCQKPAAKDLAGLAAKLLKVMQEIQEQGTATVRTYTHCMRCRRRKKADTNMYGCKCAKKMDRYHRAVVKRCQELRAQGEEAKALELEAAVQEIDRVIGGI